MGDQNLKKILSIPVKDLKKHSKVKIRIVPDVNSVYHDFARTIADEIKENNDDGNLTRIILPVGPVISIVI